MSSQKSYLGEFEQVLLLALMHNNGEAYGAQIQQLLEQRVGRKAAIGAIYATCERLQNKGLVTSFLGEPTQQRGGRAKRYFQITAAGKQALKTTKQQFDALWQGVSLWQR